jgi:hypothetical protein
MYFSEIYPLISLEMKNKLMLSTDAARALLF